jgi:hypothetical protein
MSTRRAIAERGRDVSVFNGRVHLWEKPYGPLPTGHTSRLPVSTQMSEERPSRALRGRIRRRDELMSHHMPARWRSSACSGVQRRIVETLTSELGWCRLTGMGANEKTQLEKWMQTEAEARSIFAAERYVKYVPVRAPHPPVFL